MLRRAWEQSRARVVCADGRARIFPVESPGRTPKSCHSYKVNNVTRTARPAGYYVDHNSHGFSLIVEFGNDEAESLGLFPTKAEALAARDALRSLHRGGR